MKKLRVLVCLFIITGSLSMAQPYDNSVGVKIGYSTGIVFKHFSDDEFAFEAQALYNNRGFQLSALYEYQFSPHPKERLYYFAGAGLHGGNWENEFALGAALLAGSEYVFRKAPVILGLEWKPMINFYKQTDLVLPDIAVTAKVKLN